eukprot:161595-Prorocentrum_minimum.AAC.4
MIEIIECCRSVLYARCASTTAPAVGAASGETASARRARGGWTAARGATSHGRRCHNPPQ